MDKKPKFIFSKTNYILMAVGVCFIILGFILMATKGSTDINTFNPKTYDAQRTVIAPILVITGFVIEFFAIFKK